MSATENTVIEQARARRAVRDSPARARQLRLDACLSQAEVARALGVSKIAVSRWERGERTPRPELAQRYMNLLRRAVER